MSPLLLFVCLLLPHLSSSLTLLGDTESGSVVGFPLVVDLYTQSRFNLTISLPLGTYDSNIASLLTGQTDFSITSGPLTAAQAASYPNATVLPILSTAIVPIYRLDGLNSSSPLTLSGSTLALIFAGQITWWNDSLIQADNLGAVFPKQPITVAYQNDSQTFNYVFTEALNKFNSSISSVLPPSRLPSWPTALYAHSQPGLGVQGVVALVLDFDGTIGFCHQQTAQVNDANIANMINRAGQVVSAGTSSVIFTVHELSTQPTALPIHFPSLTDCTTTSCWPIVITSWLLIDTSASPRGCEVREEMVNFWLFYFSATTAAAAVLVNYNIVQTPPVILSALSVTSTLNWVSCNGQPVVPVTPTTVFNLLSPVRLAPLVDPLIDFHAAQFTSAVDFETEPVADAITAMTTGWATNQLTFFYPTEIEEQSVEANVTIAVDYDNFLVVPTFLTSLVWKYNPQISPSVTLNSSVELVLEWEILVAIFTGNLTSWKDPRMVALNPVLGEVLLSNEAAPLGVVFGCLTQTYLALLIDIITNLVAYAEEFNPALLAFLYYQSESATAFMRCDPIFPTWLFVSDETTIGALVQNSVGSIGYQLDDIDSVNVGEFTFMYPQRLADGSTVMTKRYSTPDSLRSCVTSMDPDTLQLTLKPEMTADCYPLTNVLYAQVPKLYPVEQKVEGYQSLALVSWMINSTTILPYTESAMLIQVGSIPSLVTPLINALNSVTCDGETLLITLPVVWTVSSVINRLGIAVFVIGALLTLSAFAFIFYHRRNSAVRSTSPTFFCLSLVGVLTLMASMLIVTRPTPDSPLCSALNWTAQLGFTLLFAPLFLKAYRIYRIFGGKKLKVVKITNTSLLQGLAAIVLLDVIYLSVWQGVAPMSSVITMQLESDQREHSYQQCSFSATDTSTHFFVASVVIKAAWLCVGVLLAFSTRSVTDQFNESKSIALAIYNVVFAVGLIAPLTALIAAQGDVRVILLLFCLLWVSYFTLGLLAFPKVLELLSSGHTRSKSNSVQPDDTQDTQYDFLPLDHLTSQHAVHQYLHALEKHVTNTRTHLAAIKGVKSPERHSLASHNSRSSALSPSGKEGMRNSPLPKSPVLSPMGEKGKGGRTASMSAVPIVSRGEPKSPALMSASSQSQAE